MRSIIKEFFTVNVTENGIKIIQNRSNDEILISLLIEKRDSIKDDNELRQKIQELLWDII